MDDLRFVDGRITASESDLLDFKSCKDKLSRDFWPTYSAFANTFGGTVYMGVDDKTREITGVDDPDKVVEELWDILDADGKVSSNIISPGDVEIIESEGRHLIKVVVPRAERRKRPVYINGSMENGTYKRNGEGDYHCSIEELKQMLRDASDSASDSSVVDVLGMDDLDPLSIRSFRERMSRRNPSNPWNDKEDGQFLKLIGACSRSSDGSLRPTVAGLLMFGYDYSIMSMFPNYHLDYLEFADDPDNWIFRISSGTGEFTGNVYSFMTEVANRISMTSPRGKDVDGMMRIDDNLLIRAQRELLVNALIHADYHGLRGVRVEKRGSSFSVRNPGSLRIPLEEMTEGGISDPRNPHLALMMGLIGFSERAGSGVCDVVAICRKLNLMEPEYDETSDPDTVTVVMRTGSPGDGCDPKVFIRKFMTADPSVTIDRISKQIGMERSKVARLIDSMKSDGSISRIGGTRGHWVVNR